MIVSLDMKLHRKRQCSWYFKQVTLKQKLNLLLSSLALQRTLNFLLFIVEDANFR